MHTVMDEFSKDKVRNTNIGIIIYSIPVNYLHKTNRKLYL